MRGKGTRPSTRLARRHRSQAKARVLLGRRMFAPVLFDRTNGCSGPLSCRASVDRRASHNMLCLPSRSFPLLGPRPAAMSATDLSAFRRALGYIPARATDATLRQALEHLIEQWASWDDGAISHLWRRLPPHQLVNFGRGIGNFAKEIEKGHIRSTSNMVNFLSACGRDRDTTANAPHPCSPHRKPSTRGSKWTTCSRTTGNQLDQDLTALRRRDTLTRVTRSPSRS